jgi:methionyl-tRNA formyltransferase
MTYARQLERGDYHLDWSLGGLQLHRRVMGLFPGAHSSWRGRRLQVLRSEPLVRRLADQLTPEAAQLAQLWGLAPGDPTDSDAVLNEPAAAAAPGTVLAIAPGTGVVVSTGGCPLLVRQARLEGKSALEGSALIQQLGAHAGDRLGQPPENALDQG